MSDSVEAMLTVVRALHFSAAIVLFGQFAYVYCVSPGRAMPPRFRATAGWSLGLAVATALAWLAIEASTMSGLPLGQALREGTADVVLTKTLFGHAWLVRGALAILVGVALVAMGGRDDSGAASAMAAIGALLFLATLSCAGHAAAGLGADRFFHVAADALHLLAAGAWLGALVPLVGLLRAIDSKPSHAGLGLASRVVARFSVLGVLCVGVLALTGIVNACYAIHRVSDLSSSRYGQELVVKLGLVAIVVILAALNRNRHSPRLSSSDPRLAHRALRSLALNAFVEIVLGFAIVAIVGNLGVTMPPMHAG
jgi:putative copper resistance protein D